MGSLFTSFGVGVQGIHSAQSGLNTTAHNLANVKTPGYTRQQNISADLGYQTYKVTDKATMQIGLGTKVDVIRQIRDQFLDKEYRLEFSRQNFYNKQLETENEIEDVFGEMEGVEFRYSLQEIWEQIQYLSTDPGNIVNRELFISGASSFIRNAYDVYRELTNYQTGLNNEIEKQVKKINEISDDIAHYNSVIAQIEASGVENANDYRDIRNSLLDELAGYTYYTYQEDVDGKIQVYVDQAPLVIENRSYHMACENISEDSKMYKVVWADNGYGDVYDLDTAYSNSKKTDTGSLYGILTARGRKFANYTDMPVPPEEPQEADFRDEDGVLDETAFEEAHIEYEIAYNQFKKDLKVYNNTTGNSILTKVETQFDKLIHDMAVMLNDVFCPNITANFDVTGVNADGDEFTFEAGNYRILDVVNCPTGTDDEGTIGEELFKRKESDRYTVLLLDGPLYLTDAEGNEVLDGNGDPVPATQEYTDSEGNTRYKLYVYNEEQKDNIFTQYTIRNLEINDKILANYSLMPVKVNPLAGGRDEYSQDMYTEMLSKWYEKSGLLDPNSLTTYAYDDYYNEMIDALGTQGLIWGSMLDDQTELVEEIEDKRQQMAGVSTDEELVSMLQYQHAFNAASRYINAIDELLRYLIERLA